MKTTHGLLLAAVVVFGLSAAQSRSDTDEYQTDLLLRTIPSLGSKSFKSKDEEIEALKSLVDEMRNEIIDRNDEIYVLRATERHAIKAADDCTGGKYSEKFR